MPINWEQIYKDTPPEQLPWNAGGTDPDLVRLIESGVLGEARGRHVLDAGCGLGHDAIYLAKQGFTPIAIDLSPTAIRLARVNASAQGLFIFFSVGNILDLNIADGDVDFVYDRGCFHALAPVDWEKGVAQYVRVLQSRGYLLLRVFSDKNSPSPLEGEGRGEETPHCFSEAELRALFEPHFHIERISEGIFEGPAKPKSYLCVLRKNR